MVRARIASLAQPVALLEACGAEGSGGEVVRNEDMCLGRERGNDDHVGRVAHILLGSQSTANQIHS